MELIQKTLNFKRIERAKRKLAMISGMHMKLKRLSSSASEDYRTEPTSHASGHELSWKLNDSSS
jgi:hypothetical protein